MTLEEITAVFDELREENFDWDIAQYQGSEKLRGLCDAVRALPDPEQATEPMFRLMERLSAAELGTPGPLVHTLETLPHYQASLFASFRRKPTRLTAWMVNRVLNVTKGASERAFLLALLEQGVTHLLADERARSDAREFIQYQLSKEGQSAV